MDGHHPNDKPRPKRRKAEDNPYTLSESVDASLTSHYYISFTDGQGKKSRLEISQELFSTFDRFELEDLSFLNEVDKHYEHSELTEATLNARAFIQPEAVEDVTIRCIQSEQLHRAIAELPEIQKRRLILHFFRKLSYEQIAEMEGCTKRAVKFSVDIALKKIRKKL